MILVVVNGDTVFLIIWCEFVNHYRIGVVDVIENVGVVIINNRLHPNIVYLKSLIEEF